MDLDKLLYSMPENTKHYAPMLQKLDPEDIPWERVPQLKEVMNTHPRLFIQIEAALLLTHWGDDDGFDFLDRYIDQQKVSDEVIMPHRLRGYDNTNAQILDAYTSYYSIRADDGFVAEAKEKLLEPVKKIITLSNAMQFEIENIFWLVQTKDFLELIPTIKLHFATIIKNPLHHHWKVADTAHLLMRLDPNFVIQTIANNIEAFSSYIPTLKSLLNSNLKNLSKYSQIRASDSVNLLMKIEPDYVLQTLEAYKLKLEDFPFNFAQDWYDEFKPN